MRVAPRPHRWPRTSLLHSVRVNRPQAQDTHRSRATRSVYMINALSLFVLAALARRRKIGQREKNPPASCNCDRKSSSVRAATRGACVARLINQTVNSRSSQRRPTVSLRNRDHFPLRVSRCALQAANRYHIGIIRSQVTDRIGSGGEDPLRLHRVCAVLCTTLTIFGNARFGELSWPSWRAARQPLPRKNQR